MVQAHENVWNSRPKTYGKGSRGWYVDLKWVMKRYC